MKNLILSISFLFLALFSFADGGCTISPGHKLLTTNDGISARLNFSLDMHCYALNTSYVRWFKYSSLSLNSSLTLINKAPNGEWDVCEPGLYTVEVHGVMSNAATLVKVGSVNKNKSLNEKIDITTKFSVYPNPTTESTINLLVPDSPVSLETFTYKIELFNVLGNQILLNEGLEFGTKNMPISLQGEGKGIFMLRVTSGEEVKVLKFLVN